MGRRSGNFDDGVIVMGLGFEDRFVKNMGLVVFVFNDEVICIDDIFIGDVLGE